MHRFLSCLYIWVPLPFPVNGPCRCSHCMAEAERMRVHITTSGSSLCTCVDCRETVQKSNFPEPGDFKVERERASERVKQVRSCDTSWRHANSTARSRCAQSLVLCTYTKTFPRVVLPDQESSNNGGNTAPVEHEAKLSAFRSMTIMLWLRAFSGLLMSGLPNTKSLNANFTRKVRILHESSVLAGN